MNKRKILNGFYDYTVILTYLNMIMGFCGIVSAMKGEYRYALLFLMGAGICDMFDGAVASTKKRTVSQKRFGIQIDSLSDLVSFGVLPGMITYFVSDCKTGAFICGAIYTLCALIRLAYFNVCEEERQENETGRRKYYTGLPVTSSAMIFPLLAIIFACLHLPFAWCFPILAALMAIAFVLGFPLKKPGKIGIAAMTVLGTVVFVLLWIGVGMK